MMKIKLLQQFQGNKKDETIEVDDKVANDLVNQKIARKVKKEYLVKSKIGETKAFNKSPNIK